MMDDPTEPTRDEDERPADEVSGAGYGNNAEEDGAEDDAGGGDGAEGRPDEL